MNQLIEYIQLMPNFQGTLTALFDLSDAAYHSRRDWRMRTNRVQNINELPQIFFNLKPLYPCKDLHQLLYAFREYGDDHLYQLARGAFPGIEPDESRFHEEQFIEYLQGIPHMPDILTSIVDNSVSHHCGRRRWLANMNSTVDYHETPRFFLNYVEIHMLEPYVLHAIRAYGDDNLYELARNVFPGIEPLERGPLEDHPHFPELFHHASWREDLIMELNQPKLVDGVVEKVHSKMLRMANIIGDNELIEFVKHIIENMDPYDGTFQESSLPRHFLRHLEGRRMERIMLNNNFTYALNDPIISQYISKTYGGDDLLAERVNEILVIN